MSHFGSKIHEKWILGFTEMEKDGIIFRADVDFRGSGPWYDNVMVDWDSTDYMIPAELRMMFRFENESQSYAVIHSCHNKFTKHSVLSNLWIKEYQNDTPRCVNDLRPFTQADNCSKKMPLLQVIPCEAIHSH